MKIIRFTVCFLLALLPLIQGCVAAVQTVARETVNQRMDKAFEPYKQTTFVSVEGSEVCLVDNNFKIRITMLMAMQLNGIYALTCDVENLGEADALFNPDLIELEGVDTSLIYLSATKGKMDQSILIKPGKKAVFNLSFLGEGGKPSAQILKVSFRKANITMYGETKNLIKY